MQHQKRMDYRDFFPSATVTAAAAGALLAASRGGQYTYWQRVIAFLTGFLSAIYLAPYLCEHFSITSDVGKNSVVFLVGYSANAIMPKVLAYIETNVPKWIDDYVARRLDKRND